ncbi:MAG: type 1 glutamine amidotransferase domain-containing protein [Gemmatimonadaceae bacterium]|jgi:putative intracellular protease/amidase|nr:type 1 glutamine amidotransferase domain-containing protein [Gemmatimonadaceae bacterium]
MTRVRLFAATAALVLAAPAAVAQLNASGTVVLVVSGAGQDGGRTRPGFEMDELSQAYLIFRDNGYAVTIASPTGGRVVADPFDSTEAYNARFLADAKARRLLEQTIATRTLRAADVAAVYVIGGKGAMFDLPGDTALARLATEVHARGAVVGAVCHGPAGLVNAKGPDGKPLLAGRAVTGFSNAEETLFGKKWKAQLPFLLEDALRQAGARYEEAPLMMPKVVVDGRIVTGQNPFSTAASVEAIIRALGKTPVARTPWRDERAMTFADRVRQGQGLLVRRELAAERKETKVELIGMLGYYQLQGARDDAAVRTALELMEVAAPYMPEPQLSLGIADAYWRLGRQNDARALVRAVRAAHPTLAPARELATKFGV